MSAVFTVVRGHDVDQRFTLDQSADNRLGRGLGCQVLLSDPLSSRVHAIVKRTQGQWYLKDAGSRNGTLVNGVKVDEALLLTGSRVRIGNTELEFADSRSPEEPTLDLTQTVVQNASMADGISILSAANALQDKKRRHDLLDLYQLSFRLLSAEDVSEVSELGLDVLKARMQANIVGLLWVQPNGQLRPQRVVPPDGEQQIHLSRKLTDMVVKESKAIWIKNEKSIDSGPLKRFADAICVPMMFEGQSLGAIHVYRENEEFEESDFEFVISASNILSAALFRAQQQLALQASRDRLIAKNADFEEMLGSSPPMLSLKERIVRVAQASGCILIRGESGSGKELVARAIHRASARAGRPMLSVNCAAIPAELMESQLFGHKRGAFTGAEKDHPGWFQQADTGTLFLDEVGELNMEGQAKLLRILEGHPFLPVGSNKEVRVDVRVISATNRDLKDAVKMKRFREDLFYRLSVFELWTPPLRDRGSDIPMLIHSFLDHFRRQHGRPHLELKDAAMKRLMEYSWPGNIRQLRNTIDSAVVLASDEGILPSDLGLHDSKNDEALDSLRIDDWEQKLIREAMKRTQGNVPESAELLGISRATLYRKLEIYGIQKE